MMSRYALLKSLFTFLLPFVWALAGIAQPIVGVSPAAVNATINSCDDSVTVPITISNTGAAPLNFAVGDVRTVVDSVYFGARANSDWMVLDPNTNSIIGSPVTTGGNPFRCEVTPDGSQLWISNNWDGTVSVFDIATHGLITTFSTGGFSPTSIAFSHDGTIAYVCDRFNGSIDVIDVATFTINTTILGVGDPQDLAITPDGRFAIIAASQFGIGVQKLRLSDNTIVAQEPTGILGGSHSIVLNPEGTIAYVASSQTGEVFVIDVKTLAIITVIGGFNQATGIDITPDGTALYVCDHNNGNIKVIDPATNTIVTTITDARFSQAWGLAIDRQGRYAYVSNPSGSPNDVMVVDIATNTVISGLTVSGGGVRGMASGNWPLGWVNSLTSFGTIAPGGSAVVSLRFYSQGLPNGVYTGVVTIDSDDPLNPLLTVPVTLTVNGSAGLVKSDSCILDTTVQEFATVQDTFFVFNPGCDSLRITSIAATLPEYTPDVSSLNIASCDTGRIIVTFAPLAPGNYSDLLTMQSNAGDSTICLQGMAVAAPEININPDPVVVSTNSCCDTVTTSVTFSNVSTSAPLEFEVLPAISFAEDFDPAIEAGNWFSVAGGSESMGCGADDGNAWYMSGGGSRELITNPINVAAGGTIEFRVYMSNGSDGCNAAENGEDVYLDYSVDGGTIWTLIGIYDEAVYTPSFSTVSEAIPLLAQTNATMFRWRQIGADCNGCDIAMIDDIAITGSGVWFSSDTIDTIPPSGSQSIDFSFISCDQNAGVYNDSIYIVTNDPRNPLYALPYEYTINGSAELIVPDTCLDLDTAMQFTSNVDSFYVYNPGCDTLDVTSITNLLPEFTIDTTSFQVLPYDSLLVQVTFQPITVGDFFDTLNVQTSVGDSLICLLGVGIEAPTISTTPDTLYASTNNCCDTTTVQLTISNGSPAAPLDWVLVSGATITDNFDGGVNASLWGSIEQGTANTNCGSVSGDALHFDGGGANRWAQSVPLNTSSTSTVDFCILFGTGVGLCENADGGEDVVLEYSIDGGVVFNQIQVLDEAVYTSWTCLSIPLPVAAQTTSTIIRWRQVSFSSCTGCDNWALDNVTLPTSNASIVANPDTASTAPSGSTLVDVGLISCDLSTGVYFDSITIFSNDPLQPQAVVYYEFTVNGAPEIAISDSCLDLDTILELETATETFWVYNTGCDTLQVTSTTNNLTEFSVDTLAYDILPGDSIPILVEFAPTSAGTFNDTFLISSNAGDSSICVVGVAEPRPIISHQPDSFNITLACVDSILDSLWIYNTGLGELQYDISGDSVQLLALTYGADLVTEYPNTISALNTHFNQYILTESGTTDPAVLTGLLAGKDVVLIPEREFGSTAVWTTFATPLQNFTNAGGTVIFLGTSSGQSGSIFNTGLLSGSYGGFSTGIATVVDSSLCLTDSVSATFSAASASYYYNFTNPDVQELVQLGGGTFVAYRPFGNGQVIYIGADYFSTNTDQSRLLANAVSCFGGGLGGWITASMLADTVAPADSSLIEFWFNSTGLTAGTYQSNIIINSNDPLLPIDTVPVTLTVVGLGEMNFVSNCLDLDSIMEYTSSVDSVGIINTGCDTLFVTNITNVEAEYSVDTTNFAVLPGDTFQVAVTFSPTGTGTFYDTLTIFSNVGDSLICLEGDAFGRPILDHSPDTVIVQATGCCDTVDATLMLYNTGQSPLTFSSSSCSNLPLDSVLNNFNNSFASITANVPSVFSFTDGIFGSSISDGGSDMYDGGNALNTTTTIFIPYSDNVVTPNVAFGTNGGYFTRKQDGIFMMAADLDAMPSFFISGNLGADGSGNVDTTRITLSHCGTSFTAYIKRVYNAFDPSVNHMIISEQGDLGHDATVFDTDNDFHEVSGITGNRIYYLLFSTSDASYIDDAQMTTIFQSFLDNVLIGGSATATINPQTDTIPAGDSLQVTVSINSCDLAPDSTYLDSILFTNNNPLEPQVWVPLVIIKDTIPATPIANDTSICFGSPTPDLIVSHVGDSATWYSDPSLSTQVFTGDVFATGETAVGTYTYYVVTWLDSCNSLADTVTLTINTAPVQPVTNDESACFGQVIPDLIATGTGTLLWYDDGALTNQVFTGSPFATGETTVGTYTYYVVDSISGCPPGPSDTVTLSISPLPAAPIGDDTTICQGNPTPDLTATGSNLSWYSDGTLTTLIHVGNNYVSGITSPGVYNFYVTQNPSGCEGPADTVTLNIIATTAPVASDTAACFGDPTPDLTATGTSIQWYDDGALTNLVNTGATFATGETAVGVYTYYVTQTANGCESPATTVVLTIDPIPGQPGVSDTAVCETELIPDLTATGNGITWYDDGALTNVVATGNTFATGQTAPGVYTYYVTQANGNCPGPSDTVSLTIIAAPTAPVANDTTICFGQTTPDLTATGTNVLWYSDGGLTNQINAGNTFVTGETAVGVYTYYLRDSVNGCYGPPDTVELTINSAPVIPISDDDSTCFGQFVPDLVTTGVDPAWYTDLGLTNQVAIGNVFPTGETAVGTYTYYVSDSLPGCPRGPIDTVSLIIHPTPANPVGADETACVGDPVPDLTATGSGLNWYSDGGLTTQVGVGSPFATGETAPGLYTYYVTQTDPLTGCESAADTVTLTIFFTNPPVAADTFSCFGDPTPDLSASGNSVQWYSDGSLTTLVNTGNTFATGETVVGTYTYYVTQTENGCESEADTAELTIFAIPSAPIADNDSACFGSPVPDLIAAGSNVQWYSDGSLTTLVNAGNVFATGQTAVGVYTYYVTQSINGCESPADTVTLEINPIPASPVGSDQIVCFGDPVPDLTAIGSNLEWYDDGALTNLVFAGNPFPTGQTAVGTYTYYVTQTTTGCPSMADTVTLSISTQPVTPLVADIEVCVGEPVPDFNAAGTIIQWYDDGALTNVVFTGSPFATGETAVGTYTYYVTDSVPGCVVSGSDTATLTIHPIPAVPVAVDTAVCQGDPTPDLSATGTNVQWYSDGGLTTLVFAGSPFATGETNPGTYTYYVTQTINGCESPADTVTLTIYGTPSTPFGSDQAACEGETIPNLTALGASVTWYDDMALTNQVGIGPTLVTGQTTAGSYTYYATQTINGCEGPANAITLIIHPQPAMVQALDTAVCEGQPVPDLTSTGTMVTWYNDAGLTNVEGTGNTFSTGQTAAGVYTYYVTQTSGLGCESVLDTAVLTINSIPSAPLASDTTVCFGDPVPDLTAAGSNIQWYSDANLTTLVFAGSPFATGQTAIGSYTYYATQSINGCESVADTVTLTISTTPLSPIASDTTICEGQPTPTLTVNTGTNVTWYSDGTLTTVVGTGLTFTPTQTTPGVYNFFVTDSLNGCGQSAPDTATLVINALPSSPVANDTFSCEVANVPDLTASGANVRWYDDGALTNLVATGNVYATGQTAAGVYTYYVTQSTLGCESIADTVTLTIYAIPSAPIGANEEVCEGLTVPDLTASGSILNWYDDGALTNLVGSGTNFATGQTTAGTYTYYVTQSFNGCESPSDTVTLTIHPLPAAPVGTDEVACEGGVIPGLTAVGTSLNWYDDGALTNLVGTGSPFNTGETTPGVYTFYVTQTDANTCEGSADTVTLTINALPAAPIANDTFACEGTAIPDLTAAGTSINWYDDGALTNLVGSGSTFSSGQTTAGTYTYFATQTVNGCEGPADTVTLTIFAIPSAPIGTNEEVCEGLNVPDLTATGSNLNWYDDGALTNLVGSGASFATGQTTAGTYTYYVTQSLNGCESPSDTVTLTIHPLPAAPIGTDEVACEGGVIPGLTAVGTNLNWYDDGALTNLVGTGSPFNTGETTPGVYTYYVTQTDANTCEGSADTVTLTINALPAAPIANDTFACEGTTIPDLTATGTNINWYDDGALTNLVGSGSTFATGQTTAGTYTYYATQTVNGCEGPADTVTLTIFAIPSAPIGTDEEVCEGLTVPDLTAAGSNLNWYDDGALTNLVGGGTNFATGQTTAGSYTYYVTQTLNGCESPSDTVTLTIHPLPAAPIGTDEVACEGGVIPGLTAVGTNLNWYDDSALTNLVGTGSPFNTGETAPGVYTYYVTQTDGNTCEGSADTVTLTINALPAAPIANDTFACEGTTIPDLTAAGTSINWYDDGALTNLVGSGNTFSSGQTTAGTYTYYATQTVNGCEGPADTVTLTIFAIPSAPIGTTEEVCEGLTVPDLTAAGSNLNWYDDGALTNLVGSGANFATGQTAAGTYTYYVTQSLNGCESPSDTVTLTIHPLPAAPIGTGEVACEGGTIPGLTAVGTNLNWYDDGALTNLVGTGSPFNTGATTPGVYTYYVTQTDANTCEGSADTVTLTINALPAAPIANDTFACEGTTIPDLTATGTNINWYDDGALTNLVGTGTTFSSGQTTAGTYTYYATQTVNGCEGPADTVTLTIFAIPSAPIGTNEEVCEGLTVPDLTATGSNLNWYDDGALTNLVGSGANFATGQTTAGTYTYYVTQSLNGCESLSDTVTLTIHALPSAPVASDTSSCEGAPVPSLTATGLNVQWYDDGALTNLVGSGSTFVTGQTAAGVYTYYVTQTDANTCESNADTVTLTIYALPAVPVSNDTTVCFGTATPDLVATGTNVLWYSDPSLTNQVGSGNTFSTGQTAIGSYTYYFRDSTNGCYGPHDSVVLNIITTPAAPVVNDTAICVGDPTPSFTASGSNIRWYDDAALTNQVGTGSNFTPTATLPGVYTFYVTDSVNVCGASTPDTVTLTIFDYPSAPIANDTTVCSGDPIPDITASGGSNYQWYDDAALTNLVGVGPSLATGQTTAGTYTYYVASSNGGLCVGVADTVTLTILSSPTVVAGPDLTICSGDSIQLNASGGGVNSFSWTPAATLNDPNVANPFATPVVTTDYIVTGINAIGCGGYDTVTVNVQAGPCDLVVNPTASAFTICAGECVDISANANHGTMPYQYTWSNGIPATDGPHTVCPTTTTTYTVQVIDVNDTVSAQITITVLASPTAIAGPDTSVCSGDTIGLSASGGFTYAWTPAGSLDDTTLSAPNAFPLTNTMYYVNATSLNGCSDTDSTLVTVNVSANAPSGTDEIACSSGIIPDLTATGNNLSWFDDPQLTNQVGSGTNFTTGQTAAGTYTYYVIQQDTSSGCNSIADTVTLTIGTAPQAVNAEDTVACQGAVIPDLTATGSNVQWYSDGSLTTQVGSGNTFATGQTLAGIYTYYAVDSTFGCGVGPVDTVTLTISAPPTAPVVNDSTICFGETNPVWVATGTDVNWYTKPGATQLVGTGNSFAADETAVGTWTYYVNNTTPGCPASAFDTVSLTINPNPLVTLNTYSTSILAGDSVELMAFNASTYSWSPPTGLNVTTGWNVWASPVVTTTYTVTGTNDYGCTADTSVTVFIGTVGMETIDGIFSSLSIYPNPSFGQFNVDFSTTANVQAVEMVNALGQSVSRVTQPNHNGQGIYQAEFDLQSYESGVYFVRIVTDRGIVSRRVVLVD